MKDYYKILGVKESASEEEIRTRWIELTKHCHPDRVKGGVSDERIRQVNEAYQVLKHSSTRVEYDLKRTYGYEKREQRRRFYLKTLGLLTSVFILVVMGVIYFGNHRTSSDSTPPILNTVAPRGLSREMPTLFSKNQGNPTQATIQTNKTIQANRTPQTNSAHPKQPSTPKATALSSASFQADVAIQTDETVSFSPLNSIAQAAEVQNLMFPVAPETMTKTAGLVQPPSTLPKTSEPKAQLLKDPIDPINTITPINPGDQIMELAQFRPPSLLATEEEVNKFFETYIERYQRTDIEAFLSLFSSKAIQNQKDGVEAIRKIYTDFFNQGKEVRYRMQDMKIEIYQNAVEVRAHYEIEQILKKGDVKKVWRGQVRWVLGKEDGSLKIISLDYQHQKTS